MNIIWNIILKLYSGLWFVALFLLKRNKRLSDGWAERVGNKLPEGKFDLWIQSASGGESLLTSMVLQQLAGDFKQAEKIKILVTSTTRQGIDTLQNGVELLGENTNLEIHKAFFPFDAPWIMKKAFKIIRPRMVVVMETELWPSFFVEAKKYDIPLFLVNGRMSPKSYKSYKYLKGFFREYGPDYIWAISEDDQQRFKDVCGEDKAQLMHNIKFDRMEPSQVNDSSSIKKLFAVNKQIVLLGSIRKEEEESILATIKELKKKHNNIQFAIVPKHIERADNWLDLLKSQKLTGIKRSEFVGNTDYDVIVWDTFGELAKAYNVADAVFVGGSLVDLGGQNFLEPLAYGIRPVIGPYWQNFFWVGREIVEENLVIEVSSASELTTALINELESPEAKEIVLERVNRYLSSRKGGTQLVCNKIIEELTS